MRIYAVGVVIYGVELRSDNFLMNHKSEQKSAHKSNKVENETWKEFSDIACFFSAIAEAIEGTI